MPHNHPGSSRTVSPWKMAGMPMLLLLFAFLHQAQAQNIPKMGMPAMPSLPTRELPNPSADLPNREMLQEAKQARQRYAELNRKYAQLKKEEADSTLTKEDFSEFKNEFSTFLTGQKSICNTWSSGMDSPLANVLGYHGKNLDFQIRNVSEAVNLRETGDILQLSERNFRSLFDEHLYSLFGDPLEGHLLQTNTQGFRGKSGFFEGGMDNLLRPAQLDKEAVASGFKTRVTKALGERIPVKHEQVGRLQSIKQRLGDINPFRPYANTDSTVGRFSLGLHYGVMRSWSEQVFAHTHIGYRLTGGTELFGGFVLKRDWESKAEQGSEGHGFQAGVRFVFGDYFIQGAMERTMVRNKYPGVHSARDFSGWVTFPRLDAGRTVPLSGRVKTVFVGSYDPMFEKNRRLNGSRFMLKVGFEIN